MDKYIYRPYAKAPKGRRIFDFILGRKYLKQSVLAGRIHTHELLAPLIYNGTATSQFIFWWLENMLIPTLKPNSVLIWDNAPVHNSKKIKELIESFGHTLIFLPPYSPDFNPIENKWAELKYNIAKYHITGSDFMKSLITEVNRLAIYNWV
jgi:transposase